MYHFTVPSMTCNHCVMTITKAIKQIDEDAELNFNLADHALKVASSISAERIKESIEQSGYEVAAVS